ncbi:hypothetical protein NEMIN01_2362 [Nematocida minor]|uniref:uncharacterized protein n=1 Tax=Nematocida minor TaxID=1912983 RepID=UPI0022201879|nr:uncharacterized protein NEMIN01_2362 [Nematocida minor]KAI5193018.1 hypothetical protein NEMIN01_2362 [Nematocida minor]
MKNQKLRKIVAVGTVLLGFFIAKCRGGRSAFSGEEISSASASVGKKRKEVEISSPIDAPLHRSAPENKRQKKDGALKEKSSSIGQQDAVEIVVDGGRQPVRRNQAAMKKRMRGRRKELELKNLDVKLWNDRRLENKRRKGYKLTHKSIYACDTSDAHISEELEKKNDLSLLKHDIEEFSSTVASQIENNALWYLIAIESTNINAKYKDLWKIRDLFRHSKDSKYRKIVEGLKGYYPGVFDDMIEYVQKHQPMKASKKKALNVWKETLGDVYMRKDADPDLYILKEQESAAQIGRKYHEIAHATRMILLLPEVCQDFSTMHENHIFKTRTSADPFANKKKRSILMCIRDVAIKIKNNEEKIDDVYMKLYNAFVELYSEEKVSEMGAVTLYRDMYALLERFYEDAEVFDDNEYVLAGKCIIKSQKYMECRIKADISKDTDRGSLEVEYSLEENRWSVSPDVCRHYHVYCVNNTTCQLRMLCMPMYVDESGKEHYLHTIDEVVEHIRVLYEIEEDGYHIHPFKVRKETREWSYIQKEERKQTIKDLEGYEVVFYRIEEDLDTANFTFAEFWPFSSDKKDSICIPLLITPLMQSAVELGPFIMTEEHAETKPMDFENRVPSVYEYDEKKYKDMQYSDVHSYYSNLHILPEERESTECYFMECAAARQTDGRVEAVWHARMPSSVGAYTHCVLDGAFREKENAEKFSAFIKTVKSRVYYKDSEMQAFWLHRNSAGANALDSQTKKIDVWLSNRQYDKNISRKSLKDLASEISAKEEKIQHAEENQRSLGSLKKDEDTREEMLKKKSAASLKSDRKKKLESLYQELYIKLSKKPDLSTEFIVFRNVNHSKSNLCAHNEILDVLITRFNKKAFVKEE